MKRPSAEASIDIDAPPEQVWAVMIDLANYHQWNPFIVRADLAGPLALGAAFRLHVRWNDGTGATSGERVTELVAPGGARPGVLAYRFTGPLPTLGLVRATRVQRVDPLPGGRTRYFTREEFAGLLTAFLPLTKVQDGFERHARALKDRAEALAARASS